MKVIDCANLRLWLGFMVRRQQEHGATFERCDDPETRTLGMRHVETGDVFEIGVTRVSQRRLWGVSLPLQFEKMLITPDGRDKLAWVLSVGDHCLRFTTV